MYDLRPFAQWILQEFEPAARVDGVAGRYAASLGDDAPGLYGLADMACVLYTIDALAPDERTSAIWRDELTALQDPETGYILEREPTHCPLHNTAFALGAMHLLGWRPADPLHFAADYDTPEKLRAFLADLDWASRVYGDSHAGAGLASAFALAPGTVGPEWFEAYFEFLDGVFDPRNGMMGRDKPAGGDTDQIGGTFHYAFLYEHFARPMPHAPARIDAILHLQQPDGLWHEPNPWWLTLDAVYLLTRGVQRCGHRRDDVAAAVRRAVDNRFAAVADPMAAFRGRLGVHRLTAAISLFAEAQQLLGDQEIVTDKPLRLVLDQRPFI